MPENYCNNIVFAYVFWIKTILPGGGLILLHSLSVRNEFKFSGWHLEICCFRFEYGDLLSDLIIFPESTHALHFHRYEIMLFCPLMASTIS